MRKNPEVETLLTRWLERAVPLPILDDASVALARERVREVGARQGLPATAVERLALAASELGKNQLRHAGGGVVALSPVERDGVRGLELVAADRGRGLREPGEAMSDRRASGGESLGIGFSSVFRNCDEVDVDSRELEGLCVRARVFAGPVPRSRQVAVLGRPIAGERVSGDDAAVRHVEGGLLLLLADGLGHGPEARQAAVPLCEALLGGPPPSDPAVFLVTAAAALQRTRGTVACLARLDSRTGELLVASVGNVSCQVLRPDRWDSLPAQPGVLGRPGPAPRLHLQRATVGPHDVLLLMTDGVSTRGEVGRERALRLEPPLVIADMVMRHQGKKHDDATVIVAK